MSEPPVVAPARLLEGQDESADLLRQVVERPAEKGQSFSVLMERKKRRSLRGQVALATVAATAVVGYLAADKLSERAALVGRDPVALLAPQSEPRGKAIIAADAPLDSRDNAFAQRGGPTSSGDGRGSASTLSVAQKQESSERARPAQAKQAAEQRQASQLAVGPDLTGAPRPPTEELAVAASGFASECGSLSRQGQLAQAVRCYEQKAGGQGTGAELALLEAARILHRALGDSVEALERLDTYERRFSSGALRREAALLRVAVLRSLGRGPQARRTIDAIVDALPERESELLLQALSLAVDEGECDAATKYAVRLQAGGTSPERFGPTLQSCNPALGKMAP